MTKKILVLDLGGIFFYPAWRLEGVNYLSDTLNIPLDSLQTYFKQKKASFYTGQISEDDYWEGVTNLSNKKDSTTPTELAKVYRSFVQPIQETISLLPEMSNKYTLYACNNSPKEWMDYRIKIASLDKYFTKFFTSGYIGAIKPDTAMFDQIFIKEDSREIVYIDDNPKFVEFVKSNYKVEAILYKHIDDLLVWMR